MPIYAIPSGKSQKLLLIQDDKAANSPFKQWGGKIETQQDLN